jgi:predicted nucleic acid-binding protein
VAVKWVLYEPGHVQALRLLEEELSGSLMLIAPDLLLTEFASLIAKRVRRKHMSAAEAIDAFSPLRGVRARAVRNTPAG